MSPKNAIKMINIQSLIWSTLVRFGPYGPIRSIWSFLVHSVLFNLVHIGLIQSTLFLFGPLCLLWSILFTLVHLSPIRVIRSTWSYLVHFVHFGSIWSIILISVIFNSHCSYLVHFGPVYPLCSYSVPFCPFCSLWYYLVPFCHFGLVQSTLFLFGPIMSIWSTFIYLVQFGPF